tara:strand:- start:285 stop:407 length:123 start_codon:yes stop_codon:yes gene_type:complete
MTLYNPTNGTYRTFETEWEKAEYLRANPEATETETKVELS